MFRFLFRSLTTLCLIAGFLLWKSGLTPEKLPAGAAGWLSAYFDLFHNPVAAAAMLAGCLVLATASACVTELLLALVFSALSAGLSFLCLFGLLGGRFPLFAAYLEHLLR